MQAAQFPSSNVRATLPLFSGPLKTTLPVPGFGGGNVAAAAVLRGSIIERRPGRRVGRGSTGQERHAEACGHQADHTDRDEAPTADRSPSRRAAVAPGGGFPLHAGRMTCARP